MENVCTIYLYDCKINKLQQSMLIFMLTLLLTNAFMRKKSVFAAFCVKCPSNLSTGFERNYFFYKLLLLC